MSAPIGFDTDGISYKAASQLETLEKLAIAESNAINDPRGWTQVALASSPVVQPPVDFSACENVKLAEVLRAMADAGVILPVREFLSLTLKTASAEMVRAVTASLDGIFTKLSSDPDVVATLETNAYVPAAAASNKARIWAEKVALTHGVRPHDVETRAYRAAIRDVRNVELVREKSASNTAAAALAQQYALYKIAAFTTLTKKYGNCWLTANHCVLQNYVT